MAAMHATFMHRRCDAASWTAPGLPEAFSF